MLLLGWTAQGRAEPLRNAPNSRVAMELPESFKPNDGEGFLEFFLYRDSISTLPPMDRIFTFIDVEIPCAIFVLEYAAEHYEKLKLDIKNTEALARAGIAEIKAKKFPDRSGEYVYITGNSEDGDVEIFNMVMHEHNLTVSIFVEIQKKSIDNNSFILTQIEHALSSASVKASHLSDEDFRLDYLGPFKRMGRAPGKDIGIFYGMSEDPFNRPFLVSLVPSTNAGFPTPALPPQKCAVIWIISM